MLSNWTSPLEEVLSRATWHREWAPEQHGTEKGLQSNIPWATTQVQASCWNCLQKSATTVDVCGEVSTCLPTKFQSPLDSCRKLIHGKSLTKSYLKFEPAYSERPHSGEVLLVFRCLEAKLVQVECSLGLQKPTHMALGETRWACNGSRQQTQCCILLSSENR